jgi:hypothetical protein
MRKKDYKKPSMIVHVISSQLLDDIIVNVSGGEGNEPADPGTAEARENDFDEDYSYSVWED